MGYACPVCGDPQADAGHLANHLAITAIARGGDHEAWLDEQVPDWEERGEEALAPTVVDEAAETDYPQVFEDTTGEADDHDHAATRDDRTDAAGDLPVDVADPRRGAGDEDLDAATREALQRARDLQAQAGDGRESQSEDEGGSASQSDDEGGAASQSGDEGGAASRSGDEDGEPADRAAAGEADGDGDPDPAGGPESETE